MDAMSQLGATGAGKLSGGGVSGLERTALRRVLDLLGKPPVEFLLWNGEVIGAGHDEPVARVWIRKRSVLPRLLFRPDLHFGEAYSSGDVEVEGDLVKLIQYAYPMEKRGAQRRLWDRLKPKLPVAEHDSLTHARSNIHHHYDIGNDFYRLWLDQDMVYTCAYFPTPEASLEEAQRGKMDYVCRKLRLRPGETVVEAGCGWGSLARYMARHYGVTVRAYNISREQIAYAREQANREGLDGKVEFIEEDYRAITGEYDAFVSVGMLEHVGKANYAELGTVIDRSLGPRGRGLLHSIGRDQPRPLNAWIERHIFPGAYPPALMEMLEVMDAGGLSVLDVENLRPHYARTLEHWLARYEASADQVEQMFDESFVRAWRFYLASSVASFHVGALQLFQVMFSRAGLNDAPWTRDHLYGRGFSNARH